LAKDIYERMDDLLSVQKRYPEQEKWLLEYEALFVNYKNKLDSFYRKMVEQFPENADWLYRLGAYRNQHGSDWEGAHYFEQIIALDIAYPAMAHIRERVGQTYGYSSEAISHFKEALRLDSTMVAAKHSLVDIYDHNRQFEEAIPVLEDLLRNGQINLPLRMQLGDLYALSGKFVDADSLLTKADNIKFEPTPGLNEIRGKLAMYQARYEEAIRFYEAEIALKPENMRQLNHYTLARLAAKAGNQTAALAWLKKTLEDGFNYKWVIKYDDAWSEYQQNQAFNNLLDAHKMRPNIF
jgi:tetratricopeptide (TPR) repeat protein